MTDGRTVAERLKDGETVVIAGYLGDTTGFAHAVGDFAAVCADQTERDLDAFSDRRRRSILAGIVLVLACLSSW